MTLIRLSCPTTARRLLHFLLKAQFSLIFAVIRGAHLSFLLGLMSKTRCKEIFYRFLRKLENIDRLVDMFWRIKRAIFTLGISHKSRAAM